MKRPRSGSTIKQSAYARKLFNANGKSKKEIALSVGYSKAVAENAAAKIESTEGFLIAMEGLAHESSNLLLGILSEYKRRGLEHFSNKDLNGAANAISSAWDRVNKSRAEDKNQDPNQNRLKKVVMQRIENQTIINTTPEGAAAASKKKVITPVREAVVVEVDEVPAAPQSPVAETPKENPSPVEGLDLDF